MVNLPTPSTAPAQTVSATPPSFVISIVTLLARHGLTALGGVLISAGVLSPSASTELITSGIGIATILAGVLWSVIEKDAKLKQITGLLGVIGGN